MTQVWCANLFSNLDTFAPYEGPGATAEEQKALVQGSGKNRFGFELALEDFPSRVTSMRTPPVALTDYAFISGRFPMVSPKLAEVLRSLDMGVSSFYQTQFFSEDGTAPLEHAHLFWNFANRKDALAVDACHGISRLPAPKGRKIAETYASRDPVEDGDLAVNADALTGPDFWVDSKYADAVFFSARFENLMSETGFRALFPLKTVRVI